MLLSKKTIFLVGIVAAGLYAGFSMFSADAEMDNAESAQPIKVAQTDPKSKAAKQPEGKVITVGAARTGVSVTLGGTVIPYKTVMFNAEMPGDIEHIAGREGDEFKENSVLVRIDDATLLAKRQELVAQWRIAESSLRNADVQYRRTVISPSHQGDTMLGGLPGIMSRFTDPVRSSGIGRGDPDFERYSDIHSQRTQLENARSALEQTEAQLKQLDEQIRNTRSVAPFNGVMIKKMIEVGDTVQPGQPLIEFADIERLQMQVEVPSRLVAGLKEGMMLPAKLDVGDMRVEVRVAQIYPSADRQRHSVTVKFDLPKGAPASPGMYAEIRVPDVQAYASSYPVVPVKSLLWRGTLPAVFIVNEENKTELRVVRVGELVDEDYVTILSGLFVGERIMMSPHAVGWSSGRANSRFLSE